MRLTETNVAEYLSIRELRHDYCHYVDAQAFDQWASLFAKDAILDIDGRDRFTGRSAIETFGRDVLGDQYRYSAHMAMNPRLQIDSDSATGEWYFLLTFAMTDGRTGWSQGTYDETYRLVDDEWVFEHVDVSFGASSSFDLAQSMG